MKPLANALPLSRVALGWRIKAAALLLAGACAWLAWPTSTHRPTRGASASKPEASMSRDLKALPGLQRLQHAGELPSEAAMKRDLFLFDEPRTAGPEPRPAVSSIQLPVVEDANEMERRHVLATAPAGLRYLGFLRGAPVGLIGAFMRGDEPETLPPGSVLAGWRLVQIGESAAIFQSVRFPDLRFTLLAKGES